MQPTEQIRARLRAIDVLCGTCLVGVIAGTIFLALLPLYTRTARADDEAFQLRNKLAKLEGVSHTVAQFENELKKTEQQLKEEERRLPSSAAQEEFLSQVAKVAEEAGLTVESVSPKPLEDGATYRVMPVQIAGTGSFETCYRFLTGLRKMDRLARLDDLVLQVESTQGPAADKDGKAGEKAGAPMCRVSVSLSTFMAR